MIDLDDRARAVLKEATDGFPAGPVADAAGAALADPNGETWNALGTALARAEKLDLAKQAYEMAGELSPELVKPFANLGNLLCRRGDFAAAIAPLRRATSLAPGRAALWTALAGALQQEKQIGEALVAYERACEIEPSALVWHNIGLCHAALGRGRRALTAFETAIALDPTQFVSHFAAAEACHAMPLPDDEARHLARAAETAPDDPDVVANIVRRYQIARLDAEAKDLLKSALDRWPTHSTLLLLLSNVLARHDALAEGAPFYERAIERGAEDPGPWLHLAKIRARHKESAEEMRLLEEAAERFPDVPEIKVQIARALKFEGKVDEAEAMLRDIVANRRSVDALCTLASVRLEIGDAVEAMELIREADRPPYDPSFSGTSANMLTNYLEDSDPIQIKNDITRWSRIALPVQRPLKPKERSLDPERRLRVAYVSPDFRAHSVSRFSEPLLAAHDPNEVELYLYSVTSLPKDATTTRIRNIPGSTFVDFAHLPRWDVAQRAIADEIDVLVDIAGWTTETGLEAFTFLPAPIQITYLGFPTTLGLPEVEFRLTDALADPPGVEPGYTEKLVRLNRCAWAFNLVEPGPDVVEAPKRPVVFGSFNNLSKVGAPTIDLYAAVLERVPGSRLVLKAKQLREPRAQKRIHELFEARGVDLGRIDLLPWAKVRENHMSLYRKMDICLDTYPYNGTTTTCEALWMGVPVVSLRGPTSASRVGHSLLAACGLGHLAASTRAEYVEAAAALAADRSALAELRRTLRDRVIGSELGDVRGLARAIEKAYRELWRDFVARQNA